MTIDFFVHSEFAKSKKICKYLNSRRVYANYLSHLIKTLRTGEFSVLIESPCKDNFFRNKIPEENRFDSNKYGEIACQEEWERFSKLIEGHESDEMRIHGSYFGQCTKNFTLQLFTYLKTGENLYTEEVSNKERYHLQRDFEYYGDFSRSGIRYGISLFRTEREDILKKMTQSKNFETPFGNVNFQLLNRETLVYGLPL